MGIDGILNINKPPGKTSFQIVSLVRKGSGERKVGHAGTLDPQATGVLPVCLGQGTRVIQFLMASRKVYRAEVELGLATDTYDATGRVTQRGDASSVSRDRVAEALAQLRGSIEQIPPMYSAVKYRGTPLYRLARKGLEVPRKPKRVEVFRLEILKWALPLLTLEVECGKGTYIRSLAHDLGQTLGCGAHLKSLVRLKSGPFDIKDALSLTQLEEAFQNGSWQGFLHPIDVVLLHLEAAILGEEREHAIKNGCPLSLEREKRGEAELPELCRAYSLDGRILALLRFQPEKGLWKPEKVFSSR